MELPAPCGQQRASAWPGAMATRLTAAERWQGPRRPYLLVEGDVVQPHAHLPGEEVGAAETVLQEAPAQLGARRRVEGVPGAAQAQGGAGLAQTLGAGVVVVEETWGRDPGVFTLAPGRHPTLSSAGLQEAPPTLRSHGHVVKVSVVRLIPRLEVPLGNMRQPVFPCRVPLLSRGPLPWRKGGPGYSLAGAGTAGACPPPGLTAPHPVRRRCRSIAEEQPRGWERPQPHPQPAPCPPMYLLARRETMSFHSNTCCLSSKSVKCPEGLPISSKPACSTGGRLAAAQCPHGAQAPPTPLHEPAPGPVRWATSEDPEGPAHGEGTPMGRHKASHLPGRSWFSLRRSRYPSRWVKL